MNMRLSRPRLLSVAVLGALVAAGASQEARPPSPAAVEVRVHVSAAGRFQDDLKLEDFSLLEAGRPQKIESLTLVKGGTLARREGGESHAPRLERTYTLLFQAVDWDPKLAGAIEHLFGSVLKPGDAMTLVTPFKPYQLQRDALAAKSKAELSKGMEDVLRKDISRGGGEYRDLVNDLRRLTRAISGNTDSFDDEMATDPSMDSTGGFGIEMQIDRYRTTLLKLESLRLIDDDKFVAFAESLKAVPGQKTVVLFYQREYRPELSVATMNRLMVLYQDAPDVQASLMELFQFYKREKTFDIERVKRAFADAGIDFHFIFMEKKSQRVFGATMREQSEDMYPHFVTMAKASGGTAESSQNPAVSFQRAADASNDFYILSYVPDLPEGDGGFRTLEVRVGRAGCAVANRLGYYAK